MKKDKLFCEEVTKSKLFLKDKIMTPVSKKIKFPEIEGLTWVSEEFPDLVIVKVLMENAQMADLGLPCDDIDLDLHVDLKNIVGVKDWYEKASEIPAKDIVVVDFNGMAQCLIRIKKEELIKGWLFIKTFYSK